MTICNQEMNAEFHRCSPDFFEGDKVSVKRWIACCTERKNVLDPPYLVQQSYLESLALRPAVRMAATASLAVPADSTSATTEYFDVLNEIGAKTGIVKARNHVHRDGTNTCDVIHMSVAFIC